MTDDTQRGFSVEISMSHMTTTPAMRRLMEQWGQLARNEYDEWQRQREAFREEVRQMPLPQRTGHEWIEHIAGLMKDLLANPETGLEGPRTKALDVAIMQAELAGWQLERVEDEELPESDVPLNHEFTLTFSSTKG